MQTIYTIGHSNHDADRFLGLLGRHGVSAVVDVRSHPYSRFAPHYAYKALQRWLPEAGIAYVFLGRELGARSNNPACYRQGRVQFDRLAEEPQFADGVRRVLEGVRRYRIALMCAEREPLECHRTLLVARRFCESGMTVGHIHGNGSLEDHRQLESRMLAVCGLPEADMFRGRDELIAQAYALQGGRIAYRDETMKGAHE